MKVILQETLEGVGHLGDLIDVKDGFARNFLLPRKKAVVANDRNIKSFEHEADWVEFPLPGKTSKQHDRHTES